MLHFRSADSKLQTRLNRISSIHPSLTYALVFLALPVSILLAIALSTTVVILPLALAFGWL